jgi:hypothetical protein
VLKKISGENMKKERLTNKKRKLLYVVRVERKEKDKILLGNPTEG